MAQRWCMLVGVWPYKDSYPNWPKMGAVSLRACAVSGARAARTVGKRYRELGVALSAPRRGRYRRPRISWWRRRASLAGQGEQKLFGWFDGPGLRGTAAGFRRLPYRTPRLMAVAAGGAETAGYGPKGIEAIHDFIYELHEFDEFWSGP
jgi:hypothetical protein